MSELWVPGGRVCVVLLSGVGDVVNGLPAVNALKDHDPGCRITWIVESGPAPVLRPHPSVDEVITFDRRGGLREVWRLWRTLRGRRFDLLLNMNVYFKAAIPTVIARVPHRIAFGRDRARDLVWLFANHRLPARPPSRPKPHRVDTFFEFVEYLGIQPGPPEWRITFTGREREAQREFFAGLRDRAVVGLVPTTGRPEKDWSTDRFARLATALERDFGYRVLLLGGPGARETARARAVESAAESVAGARPVPALGPDLRRLLWLIDGCELLIAGDTGPLHIARALETPVIGLYGHTDPEVHGPYRAYRDLLIDLHNYDPDGRPVDAPERGWGAGRMELIRVEDVLARVETARERYIGSASGPGRSDRHARSERSNRSDASDRSGGPDPSDRSDRLEASS